MGMIEEREGRVDIDCQTVLQGCGGLNFGSFGAKWRR